jgi:AraC family transcriptional regulator
MDPEIHFQPDKKIAFVSEADTLKGIGRAWDILDEFIHTSKHLIAVDAEYLGICHDMPKLDDVPREEMRYDAAVTVVNEAQATGKVNIRVLGGGKNAVFLHEGSLSELENTWQSIYSEWLPSSGERLRDAPPSERYNTCPAETSPADLRTEIYIPLE